MIKIALVLLLMGSLSPALALQGVLGEQWSAVYNNGSNNYDEGADIYVDDSDNVYVTGRSYNGNNYDFATAKYNSSGTQQWASRYNGGSGDEAVAITVDGSGNVYVTGRSYTSGQYDYTTVKYNSSGGQVWVATYDNSGNDDAPAAIAVDGSGNVFVTGTSGNGTDNDYATVKYNSSGSQVWVERHDSGNDDAAVSLGLDGDGNAYVTGHTQASTSTDMTTIRYAAADGNVDWTTTYDTGNNELAAALVVDGDGSSGKVHVTGRQFGTFLNDIVTLEYDTATGTSQWNVVVLDSVYQTVSHDIPAAITTDGSGNVYVTGKTGVPFAYDYITIKYNSDGTIAWTGTYDGGNNDEAVDVGVDGEGNVFVTGLSHNGTNNDYVTVNYDSSGALFSTVLSKNNGGDDAPAAMVLKVSGGKTTVHVTGAGSNGSNNDYLTVKYIVLTEADLTVADVSGPATASNSSIIEVNNSVLNIFDPLNEIGANITGSFDVALYLAPEVSGSPDLNNLISLGTRNIAGLNSGVTDTDATTVTIPSSGTVPEGDYYFVAEADSGGDIAEADENNNIGVSSATVTIIDAGTVIDLVITDVTGPTSAARGDTISVSTTVENILGGAAGTFKVGIYLSTDSTITTADTFLGDRTVAGLAGFTSNGPVGTNVTIPLGLGGGQGTATFNYTGGQQQFVVPAGVTSVTIQSRGAKGGGTNGGLGARATATYSVTPGETLYVYVGGRGTASAGGFNGGGAPGLGYDGPGYGGSGASDVRQGGTAPANRIIVGAGGGGRGAQTATTGQFGGNGGAPDGGDGGGSVNYPGKGATITTNGAGGTGQSQNGASGNANGIGGKGGGTANRQKGGGGGGGGYRGGGGGGDKDSGSSGGGGGGSSYVGSGTSTSYTAAVGTGNGQVVITYDPFPLTYYLGAIADYEDVVDEFDENNNGQVQTSGGSPEGTTVSVVTQLNATDNSGGGMFGLIELSLGLGGLGMALLRRRYFMTR